VRHFLQREPAPGIAYEFAMVRGFLPGITADELAGEMRKLVRDDNRVVLGVAPAGRKCATDDTLRTALAAAFTGEVTPWSDGLAGTRSSDRRRVAASRAPADSDVGVTVLTLSNGMEVWLKPTTFKADRSRVQRVRLRRRLARV
jgi:zinc protease